MAFRTRRRKLNVRMIDGDEASTNLPIEREIRKKLLEINEDSATAVRVKDVLQDQRLLMMTTQPVQADLYHAHLPRRVRVKISFFKQLF